MAVVGLGGASLGGAAIIGCFAYRRQFGHLVPNDRPHCFEMNRAMHYSVNVAQGWRRLAQALLGIALLGGACLAVVQLAFPGSSAAVRLIHVSAALLMWPLAQLASAAACNLGGRLAALARFGLFIGGAGALLSLLVVMLADSRDAYSSALPILRHPFHGASMGLFLLGVIVVFVARLAGVLTRTSAAGGIVWYALLPMAVAAWSAIFAWRAASELEEPVRLSYAFWGPANLIPFLFVVLMMQGWVWLVESSSVGWRWKAWRHACIALAVAPVLIVFQVQTELSISDPDYFAQFARLVMVGAWPAALLLLVSMLPRIVSVWRAGRRADALAVLGSATMLLIGAFIGWGGDDTGTIFQAQMHLTAGALLLVTLALGGRWGGEGIAASAEVVRAAPVWWSVAVVASFLLIAAFLGLYGLTDRWGIDLPYGVFPLVKVGLAVVGVLLPVVLAVAWFSGRGMGFAAVRARLGVAVAAIDLRIRAALATVGSIALVGAVIALLPSPGEESVMPVGNKADDAHQHVVDKRREEVRLRFEQGVAMLQAGRHDEAATAFHRVLQLAPDMPEAHVNMGFAMLGIKDYKVALDFFDGAIELRTDQLNAYYGLALAYEGVGNIEGAIGAMRTYQHLTAPDDPFMPEAMRRLQVLQARRATAAAGSVLESGGQ